MRKAARRANPERQIQRAVMAHLRQRGRSGLVYWHTPNGGRRNPIEAAQLRLDGTLPGVSDICALYNRRFFALELKAPGRRPTEPQLTFIDAINKAGGYAAWVEGLDAALMALEHWGLLMPDASRVAA